MLYVVLERIARLEQALADTERKTQVLQQFAKAGIWEFDLVNNKLWWSSEVFNIFGKDPITFELSFESFLACIPEDERPRVKKEFLFSLDSRSAYQVVHRIVRPDGSIRIVEERCETKFNSEGKPMFSIGTCQDISDKQNALLMIEESANRFKSMVAKAPLAYVSFNHQCEITLVNERFCELIGASSDALIGQFFYSYLMQDQVDNFKGIMANSSNDQSVNADLVLHRPKLGPVSVAMTIKRYASSVDSQEEYHGILLDITYINEHQMRIMEKNQHLIDIAWSQSHILRHPVANLMGLLPIIKDEMELNDAQKEHLSLIEDDLTVLDQSIHRIVNKCSSLSPKF